ncbi:TonB-dependent receptor plug domain-containing protein [Horticoccus luteus]|uniref:TonB-dependent receptor plug domain-containing protein n=1 Tax=Horticoccus luteus TaxID=2862869 RepID=A0A8F9TWM3_9BACT|nr:TonB-dependent receptor plug domain-containing protein [Horticoccus luteus]QYM79407.1 TonB-dependent receptor plug domain-containing protein [Horticoccus luteus]
MNDHMLGSRGKNTPVRAALWLSLLTLPALAATAQGTDISATADEPLALEKYVTTGRFIPYAAEAPAIPVQVISKAKIEASGESGDLLAVIRRTVPQFIGNGNRGASNANIGGGSTNGGSQLRPGNVQTLVLIDGRRAAFAPVAATGGFTFVDVNSIPVSAVERIEVLSDGASTVYGSDAVSGVVNIILKKDFAGAEIGGGYRGATQKAHWAERLARSIMGARAGQTDITMSAEWVKLDSHFQSERDFSADHMGKTSTFPGAVQTAPGGPSC